MSARWVAAFFGLFVALVVATPAAAHGQDAPIATSVRVVVNAVEPAGIPAGIAVRAVEAGARLELTNHSAAVVEILGLQGESFLRVRRDGVDENRNSPTLYASRSLRGDAAPAGRGSEPDWQPASEQPVVRWHEERARIADWSVPLLIDGATPAAIRGTIETVPAPSMPVWWIGALALAVVASIGPRVPLAIVLGAVAIAVTVALAAAVTTPGAAGEFFTQLRARGWSLLTGLAVLAAGLVGWRRRADLALAATAGCAAVAAGFAHSGVFANAVIAGPNWIRAAVAVVIGLGLGLTLNAARAWYRTPTSSGTAVATTTAPS
jgi:hypothetical protein